jgi:gamma-secretase subunit APH-1
MTSAFFWLISLLLSSLLWLAVVPLRKNLEFTLFFSIVIQEIFRFLFYILMKKAEAGLIKINKSANKSLAFDRRVISYGIIDLLLLFLEN